MAVAALLIAALWFLLRPPLTGAVEIGAAAFLAAYGLTPGMRLMALGAGALDHPEARKGHTIPTPKLGGVAVIAAFLLVIGRRALADHELLAIAAAALVLMAVGAVDDTRGVSARLRLGVQVACAVMVMAAGVRLHLLPGRGGSAADALLSVLWIVGLTNAYNFIDGIDGLAAGLGALIALLLGVAAASSGQAALLPVSAALAGALLGFLPHNLRPRGRAATIFLGDSGSASVGFVLAALAIKEDWATGNPLAALAAPILIFSVLIYDMVQTTVARIASGRVRSFQEWIDYTGRDHIHHRFAEVLGGTRRALALILTLALGVGLSALGLREAGTGLALLLLLHGALILLVVEILVGAARRQGTSERRAG
ncbi:MAG TPA: MraY family glycosyltransferase [Candidatus Polarisedimenticolia bacterium]|jgi:UDP-GlcNAc:undecaprenyl-phosphate GlcNAc-1-phosphate transferase|nr:MraY family glycosyltransferase [Candidatus Polarisedimenticolia bacterium]